MSIIRSDVEFFRKHAIIDYSMIVAVVSRKLCPQDIISKEVSAGGYHLIASPDLNYFYIIGIIDYFQLYTWKKSIERAVKRVKTCSPLLETSSQPPDRYARRFSRFMDMSLV